MAYLEIALLGFTRLQLAGQPLRLLNMARVQALLVYLAVEAAQPHSREKLAGLFWPEQPEQAARSNLRQLLLRLRRSLPSTYLNLSPQTIQFNPESDYQLDVATLTRAMTACHRHAHANLTTCRPCLALLEQAVALYRGDFLVDLSLADSPAFEEWALLKREWLRREVLQALYHLAAHYEQQGHYDQAYQFGWRQIELDPLREEAHQQLMRALALSGRRSEALAQYQTLAQVLAEELDVAPAGETAALYEQIRSGQLNGRSPHPIGPQDLKRSSDQRPARSNIPAPLTPLIGRETACAQLTGYLANPHTRLVTIVGLGGIGKTHLALTVAALQPDHFAHGVYFVSLAAVETAAAIIPAIARALDFIFYDGQPPEQQLHHYLRQKTMLLVLDNFEHLLTPTENGAKDGVEVVVDLLKAAAGLKILITSRARLGLQSEQLFPLDGLDFPTEALARPAEIIRFSAAQLFLQAAGRVQPNFSPVDQEATAVVEICRLVQGLPLAILLTAAWAERLRPTEIVSRLATPAASQPLDLLAADWRDVAERQRSLRAVFDHSWRFLTEAEQTLFKQVSIFRGGFTAEAVQGVTAAALPVLMSLVNKSLLRRTWLGRFEMHDLLRQYAAEKLAQDQTENRTTCDRHSAYYCAFVAAREVDLKGARQQTALAEIDVESENVRAAWEWAVGQAQVQHLESALHGLGLFYRRQGRFQTGADVCRSAAEKLSGEAQTSLAARHHNPLLARLWTWQAVFCWKLGQSEPARQLFQAGLNLLESPTIAAQDARQGRAFTLLETGKFLATSDKARSLKLMKDSLALYQTLDDPWGIAAAAASLGELSWHLAAFKEAKSWLEESLAIRQALGDQSGIADSLNVLARVLRHEGQLEAGEQMQRQALALVRSSGNRLSIAQLIVNLGATLEWVGKFVEGHALLEESLAIYTDLGHRQGQALSSEMMSYTEMDLGRYEQSRLHIEQALHLHREIGDQRGIGTTLGALCQLDTIVGACEQARTWGLESVEVLRSVGQQVPLSTSFIYLAFAIHGLGHEEEARHCLGQSLKIAAEIGFTYYYSTMAALPIAALLLADAGQLEWAVELQALAERYPIAVSCWNQDMAWRPLTIRAASLGAESIAAAQARGRARDMSVTAAELLAEFA